MFRQMVFFLILVFVICSAVPSLSEEDATNSPVAQKAKAIVEAAHAYVQEHSDDMDAVQKALMEDPNLRDETEHLYVFMYAYDILKQKSICRAHGARPEFIGKNLWNIRTANGKFLHHDIAEMLEKDAQGWMEYEWLHPVIKKSQAKQSYFIKVILKDGQSAFIGCGFWK